MHGGDRRSVVQRRRGGKTTGSNDGRDHRMGEAWARERTSGGTGIDIRRGI